MQVTSWFRDYPQNTPTPTQHPSLDPADVLNQFLAKQGLTFKEVSTVVEDSLLEALANQLDVENVKDLKLRLDGWIKENSGTEFEGFKITDVNENLAFLVATAYIYDCSILLYTVAGGIKRSPLSFAIKPLSTSKQLWLCCWPDWNYWASLVKTSFEVYKFGGVSVENAERLKKVSNIIVQSDKRIIAVVSAIGKTTNELELCVQLGKEKSKEKALEFFKTIKEKHLNIFKELIYEDGQCPNEELLKVEAQLCSLFDECLEVLNQLVWAMKTGLATSELAEMVMVYGELWSSVILLATLIKEGKNPVWLDTREVIRVVHSRDSFYGRDVDWTASSELLRSWLQKNAADSSELHTFVATGYIAKRQHNDALITCSLGRNGSDFTAAILARLFAASHVTLWKKEQGVLSIDPRMISEPILHDYLSFEEATEMSFWGATVIHPQTMIPAIQSKIPIIVRSFEDLSNNGTRIHVKSPPGPKVVAALKDCSLIEVQGIGRVVSALEVQKKILNSLTENNIKVLTLSCFSNNNIVCVVPTKDAHRTRDVLKHCFVGLITENSIVVKDNRCLLTVIGRTNSHTLAQWFFGEALKDLTALIDAISFNSDISISVVVHDKALDSVVKSLHSKLCLNFLRSKANARSAIASKQ